jgi:ribonuclease BN (tRNA processing enzyme)
MSSLRYSSHRDRHHSRYYHEASIEVLTDGSDLTDPAIFLTIRRRRRRALAKRPIVADDDDNDNDGGRREEEGGGEDASGRTSDVDDGGEGDDDDGHSPPNPPADDVDGRRVIPPPPRYRRDADANDEDGSRWEDEGGGGTVDGGHDDRGNIASRYCLTGLPSLAGRLSSDQSYNMIGDGSFRAIFLPSLVGGCTTTADPIVVVPSRFDDGISKSGGRGGGRGEEVATTIPRKNGACLAGLPSLFLGLVRAGYRVDDASMIPSPAPSSPSSPSSFSPPPNRDDDNNDLDDESYVEGVRDVGGATNDASSIPYGEISVVGPLGTANAIDGIMDVVFGDGARRRVRPSVRACEVPPSGAGGGTDDGGDCSWWEVYRDAHLRVWGKSTTVSTAVRGGAGRMHYGAWDAWHPVVYVVMLLSHGNDDGDDVRDDDGNACYSFAIMPHASLPPFQGHCAARDEGKHGGGRGGGGYQVPDPLWNALRDLPREVVSHGYGPRHRRRHENSSPPLDFILHLDPPLAVVVDNDANDHNDIRGSDGRAEGGDLMTSRKRKRTETTAGTTNGAASTGGGMVPVYKLPIPLWATKSALARHHLITHPDSGAHPDGDEGILVRARHRSRILNGRLPFAFPLSSDRIAGVGCDGTPRLKTTSTCTRREGGGNDRIVDKFGPDGSRIALAYGLRSCTSVVLNGWRARRDDIDATRRLPFGFVSRIETICDRCVGGPSSRSEIHRDFDDKSTNGKAVGSVKCAFRGASCFCDECLGHLSIPDNVDDNEIDLDDSISDIDIAQVPMSADDRTKDETSSKAFHQHVFTSSPHILMIGTGCATPSPLRGSSSYGLFVPTSLYDRTALVLSALIECGEGTLTGLLRHLPSISDHVGNSSSNRLDVQLMHVCFIWISHSHLDHYGDLPIVVQAIANAKLKLGRISQKISDQLLVIAPSKVLKYLDVLLQQSNAPKNKSCGGASRQQMYVGVTHRDFQYSPFARHLMSTISDFAIPIPTCGDFSQQAPTFHIGAKHTRRKYYNPFASLQNVEVEHCRDAFALILQMNVVSGCEAPGGLKSINPSRFILCFSGDTRPSPNLIQKCLSHSPLRVNLLIHEGTFLDDLRGRSDAVKKRHSTTAEALNVARNMNAEACILTHFSQRYRHMSIENVSSGLNVHPFSWGIAFDGMIVPLTERALSRLNRLSQCIDSLIQQPK